MVWGLGTVAIAASFCTLLESHLALPSLTLVFLLAVLFSAVTRGLRASIIASVFSVLAYDFFFVPPYHTFRIASSQDLLALITFMVVAIPTSNLASRVRDQAEAARRREADTAALYDLSREVASATGMNDVARAIVRRVSYILNATVAVLIPQEGELRVVAIHPPDARSSEIDIRSAGSESRRYEPAVATHSGGERCSYVPLRSAGVEIGTLAVIFDPGNSAPATEQYRLLEALADQAGVAIERARLAEDIAEARLLGERERLHSILLSSISHDLRTPLASILGSATSLLADGDVFDDTTRRDLLVTIREESERLNRFVGNLLDTTRLESGALVLRRDWVEITDLFGAALSRMAEPAKCHRIEIEIEPGLPMLLVDFVLVEQVLVNLLDNAFKYSPDGSVVRFSAHHSEGMLAITVEDEGVGVPAGDLERIFDKFYRVQHGDGQSAGTGLGLSICRGIIQEHGGSIVARSPAGSGSGTCITIELPVVDLPVMPEEDL